MELNHLLWVIIFNKFIEIIIIIYKLTPSSPAILIIPGNYMKIFTFFSFLFYATSLFSQISLNTTLIDNINYGRSVNDVWGYTDENGNDYALVGLIDGVSIVKVDSNQAQEIDFVPGVTSVWRDLKTHSHYAYVTADQGNLGLTIIDLSPLPDSVRLVAEISTYFERAHNLYIADGYAYISGSNISRGTDILDLSNPESPVRIGVWEDNYFHDIYTKGDTLYGSAGSISTVIVLDISNKSNPILIGEIQFPDGGYSHNAWTSEDGNYLLTTQETGGRTVKMWDVGDLENPKLVNEYLSSPGQVANNVHIKDDYAYISHYADGLRILDISDPEHMVEVGYYDTHPSEETGFDGNWGAFPFTASNYIYASDREFGLFILSFNNKKGSRLNGNVLDSFTALPVGGVNLEIVELGLKSTSDEFGKYKLGMHSGGAYTILLSKFGYEPGAITVDISDEETKTLDLNIAPKKTGNLQGLVSDSLGQTISDAIILMLDTPFEEIITDLNGQYLFSNIPEDSYTIAIGKWGFKPRFIDVTIQGDLTNISDITLARGIVDNFELDLGWDIGDGSNNFVGPWRLTDPLELGYGLPLHPNNDNTIDPGKLAFFARTLASQLQLTSPSFDLREVNDPTIQYSYHWFPRGDNGDELRVDISSDNGQSWNNLAVYSDPDATSDWTNAVHSISEGIAKTEFMKVRYTTVENGRSSSFALLDDFKVVRSIIEPSNGGTDVPDRYQLMQNYPNPFNQGTLIRFFIPEENHTTLTIFNVLGNSIIKLVDEILPKGDYSYQWDGLDKLKKRLPSGIYLYQLKTNNFEKTYKMLLLE